jgi:hypothetical protein
MKFSVISHHKIQQIAFLDIQAATRHFLYLTLLLSFTTVEDSPLEIVEPPSL